MPKVRVLVLMLAAGGTLCGCVAVVPLRQPAASVSTVSTAPTRVSAVPCDDGGSGGVLIDGVCL